MSGDQLRQAAERGEEEQLRAHIEGGANPCSGDDFGLTALHYAVWNGHIECVKVLMVNGKGHIDDSKGGHGIMAPNLDLRSEAGYTAMHIAALGGVKVRGGGVGRGEGGCRPRRGGGGGYLDSFF